MTPYNHPNTISYTDHTGKKITGRLVDTAGDFATYYFPTGYDGERGNRSWHQITRRGEWLPDYSTQKRFYALQTMRDLNKAATR